MTAATVGVETLREELDALGLLELIEDPSLTDILVNEDGSLHALGYDGAHVRDQPVSPGRLRSCIATIAGLHRRIVDAKSPILEVSIPIANVRVTALVPPVTTAPLLALRIPPRQLLTLDDLERFGSVPPPARALLTEAVLARRTVLIAGSVGTGKTALGSALLTHLLDQHPTERLILLEEGARELHVPERRNVNRLLTPPLSMRELLKVSLRLSPDRIVVGELRGPEALDFLKASMSGHPGL
ncbi:MAG: ATPase, T2SS/T4P/T4SS family, partial [bacterium]